MRGYIGFLLLLSVSQTVSANNNAPRSVYQIFNDAVEISKSGKVPVVFLDIDDTEIRTAFRYMDVIEALNVRFEIFPPWSKVLSNDWNASHHMRPQDIVYADSFEKTLRLTLEKLITDPKKLEQMYQPNEKGVPIAMQIFFEVFLILRALRRTPCFRAASIF